MFIAAVAFVLRKQIVEQLINSQVSFSLISKAHAQSPKISDPPTSAPDYLPITNEYATLSAVPGILGFQLKGSLKEIPKTCDDVFNPLFLTAFVLADISDEDYYLKVNECMRKERKGKKWVLGYGAAQFPITTKEKNEIDRIWKKLDEKKDLLKILESKSFDLNFEEKKNLSAFADTLKKLEKHEGIISDIAKIYIFSGLGNLGKAGEIASNYLTQPFYERFYDMEFIYASGPGLIEKLSLMLKQSKKQFERNLKFDAFLGKLYFEASEVEKDALDDELDLPPSKSKMLALIKSPTLGAQTPLAWMSWASKNLSEIDFKKFLNSIPVSTLPENLLALSYYVPESTERREQMAKAFLTLLKSNKPERRTLYLEIMKNENWRKYLASKDHANTPPVFKLKREHFSDNLKNNRAILFSVFNLFKLGDYQRSRFLKTLAVRSHGLPATQLLPIQ